MNSSATFPSLFSLVYHPLVSQDRYPLIYPASPHEMNKLRRERSDDNNQAQYAMGPMKPLRIVASGTLFQTHTLSLPCYPAPAGAVRAHSVEKSRGGSANVVRYVMLYGDL